MYLDYCQTNFDGFAEETYLLDPAINSRLEEKEEKQYWKKIEE